MSATTFISSMRRGLRASRCFPLGVRFSLRLGVALSLVGVVTSCSAITETQLPDGVIGPATYNNREGATRLTQAARAGFAAAIAKYIVSSGLLTDELSALGSSSASGLDLRSLRNVAEDPPHTVRALARLARGVVGKYVDGNTSAWQALLFLYEAYSEILTADGWCSGVPLSTLDFEGDWTYRPGSTTTEIYAHAITLLDSADAIAVDSVSVQSAIRVLKARAQLALGQYAEAKHTVQSIDGGFRYTIRIVFDSLRRVNPVVVPGDMLTGIASISNHEGINGLSYISSGDPRTTAVQRTTRRNGSSEQYFFPVKYLTAGDSSMFTVASGVEAQLIMAEAAFHENDPQQMLTILNTLRTSGTYTVDTIALVGGGERIDTLWNAGIGGVAGLRPLTLPATLDAQRQLLFAERAAWLFLTGSRQGDLRRLVRIYGVDREQVYPTGAYSVPGYEGRYGTDISFGLSQLEFRNPLFTGCHYDE